LFYQLQVNKVQPTISKRDTAKSRNCQGLTGQNNPDVNFFKTANLKRQHLGRKGRMEGQPNLIYPNLRLRLIYFYCANWNSWISFE
jgi:hypothetical protein